MNTYTPIGEHGIVGDLQTSALVTTDGTVGLVLLSAVSRCPAD
jgi:hypothetical protein